MIEPTDADVGRKVIYRATGQPPEEGVITRVAQLYVMVRYGAEQSPKATYRGNLEWANEKCGA